MIRDESSQKTAYLSNYGSPYLPMLRSIVQSIPRNQSIDCPIVKAPSSGEKAQKNPFDTYKYATKRSIAISGNGLPIGCAIGSTTGYDSRLLPMAILSIP